MWLIAAATLAATLTAPVVMRAMEHGSWWAVPQADQRRWNTLEDDLARRCSAQAPEPQPPGRRAAETADVRALLLIAAAHPVGEFPFELDPDVKVPMRAMVRSIGTAIGCPRPHLVMLVRRFAAALPAG